MGFKEVVAGGVYLVREALRSPNYVMGTTGWTINYDGSAEFNNVTVRGTVVVGSATGQNISIGTSGGVAQIDFNSGLSGETQPGIIYESSFTQPNSGATDAQLALQSAQYNNGVTILDVRPPDTQDVAVVLVQTSGTTAPSGANGVHGILAAGVTSSGVDPWQFRVSNENSVIAAGPSVGSPAMILGNDSQSRLYVSVSELLSLNGSNNTETLYLNTNNAQTVSGGVVNPWSRQQSTTIAGPFTPGTGGYVSAGGISGVPCPASGTMTVWMRFLVIGNTAITAADFVAGCPNIANTTQSTTPFVATDNRCAQADGTWLTNAGGATSFVTLQTTICATNLGNPGDSLTITAQFHQNSNAAGRFFNIQKVEIGFIPSL